MVLGLNPEVLDLDPEVLGLDPEVLDLDLDPHCPLLMSGPGPTLSITDVWALTQRF